MVGGRMTRVLLAFLVFAALAYGVVFLITYKSPGPPAVGASSGAGAPAQSP